MKWPPGPIRPPTIAEASKPAPGRAEPRPAGAPGLLPTPDPSAQMIHWQPLGRTGGECVTDPIELVLAQLGEARDGQHTCRRLFGHGKRHSWSGPAEMLLLVIGDRKVDRGGDAGPCQVLCGTWAIVGDDDGEVGDVVECSSCEEAPKAWVECGGEARHDLPPALVLAINERQAGPQHGGLQLDPLHRVVDDSAMRGVCPPDVVQRNVRERRQCPGGSHVAHSDRIIAP